MNGVKLNLETLTGQEMLSLESPDVKSMYEVLYNTTTNEVVRSPYEVDRDKTIFRTRQQMQINAVSKDGTKHIYKLVEPSKRNVMDLASKVLFRDTIPAIKVKEEYRDTTQICHCRYPGHVRIESAYLYHDSDLAGSLDNVSLDHYSQFSLTDDKRHFYRKMVGDTEANTTWKHELSAFTVSVPQPWYFCTIPGAELRLNAKTPTTLEYNYRMEATASLRMRIKSDFDDEWEEVDASHYIDRLDIKPLTNKDPSFELHLVVHKCHDAYVKQLENSPIIVPCEDMIVLDSTDDRNAITINLNSYDFVRRICISVEPKVVSNKSVYHEAIVSGSLEYKGGMKKIPVISPVQLLYDDIWSSSYSLPDREGFYMLTFSDNNRNGHYDASMSLGSMDTKLLLQLSKSSTYNVRVRLYVYRVIVYEDNIVKVINALNAPRFLTN